MLLYFFLLVFILGPYLCFNRGVMQNCNARAFLAVIVGAVEIIIDDDYYIIN